MKLNKEQIVNLLCTATYNSDWLEIKTLVKERHLDNGMNEEYLATRCREDKWADRLLNGGHIVCYDHYALEDELEDYRYEIDLEKFETGLDKAQQDKYTCMSFARFLSGEDDYCDCNNIMQVVMFGELVYG